MEISGSGGGVAAALMQQMREARFAKADKDGSGGLSLEEFRAGAPAGSSRDQAGSAGRADGPNLEQIYATLDGDGDGSLTAAEMEAGRPKGPPPGGPPPGGPPPGGALSGDMMSLLLQSLSETDEAASTTATTSATATGTQSTAESMSENPGMRAAALLEELLKAYKAQSATGAATTASA
jgi:hypothetical protein